MILLILFESIILLIVSASGSIIEDGAPMVLPNCPSKCGNVSILYPFGIGKGCYHDSRFEITCNDSFNPNKSFLSMFNIEVLGMDLSYQFITVMNPVASNCDEHQQRQGDSTTFLSSTNFTGSPYALDLYHNQLQIAGCDSVLLYDHNTRIITDCSSSCNKVNATSCKTPLLSLRMSFFNISFQPTSTTTTTGCTYAFLRKKDLSIGNTTIQAPVVLSWELEYPDTASNKTCHYGNASVCECPRAHTGNPYIPNGCKIVKACANCEADCNNIPGSDNQFQCGNQTKINHGPGACANCKGNCKPIPGTNDQYHCDNNTGIILGLSFGGGLCFLLLCGLSFWMYKLIKKKRIANLKKKFFKRNGGLLFEQQISSNEGTVNNTILFTSFELLKATDNYNANRILGQGGQGTVYKGVLVDGRIVAVKKSKVVDKGQLKQFINEVVILSQINHRNVVKLLGCCLETEVPLLVYEFVVNGTLFDLIHNDNQDFTLSWEMRLQIAIEAAGGLSYLHSASSVPIYHRDVKSTNILLDEKFRAKIADFGTSRTIKIDQSHLTTDVCGTLGYLDPEYFRSSQYSDKSDVYSFGVVLVELLTGQKPISPLTQCEAERGLAARFILCVEQLRVFDIIDARVLEEAPKDAIVAVSDIARRCLNLNGRMRPTMKEVLTDLEVISRAPYSTQFPVSSEEDIFKTAENRNRHDDGEYSTATMINSDD